MEKKIIFLELPANIIEKIDEQNTFGSRSVFVSDILEKQLQMDMAQIHPTAEIPSSMQAGELPQITGELSLVNSKGLTVGKFDINTVDGFSHLADKICEISDDPIVRMKARRWR
ncbi:MAG: hypothetical protein JXA75_05485 [Candidatus Thermoplasmatota archaeon]|nr:hypothetical protein [Candidatus Thermoplasmatota archaeon]